MNNNWQNWRVEDLILYRVDATQNMRRFYGLGIEPSLFGGYLLVRRFGRIQTHGRVIKEEFAKAEEAIERMGGLLRNKKRKGYVQR